MDYNLINKNFQYLKKSNEFDNLSFGIVSDIPKERLDELDKNGCSNIKEEEVKNIADIFNLDLSDMETKDIEEEDKKGKYDFQTITGLVNTEEKDSPSANDSKVSNEDVSNNVKNDTLSKDSTISSNTPQNNVDLEKANLEQQKVDDNKDLDKVEKSPDNVNTTTQQKDNKKDKKTNSINGNQKIENYNNKKVFTNNFTLIKILFAFNILMVIAYLFLPISFVEVEQKSADLVMTINKNASCFELLSCDNIGLMICSAFLGFSILMAFINSIVLVGLKDNKKDLYYMFAKIIVIVCAIIIPLLISIISIIKFNIYDLVWFGVSIVYLIICLFCYKNMRYYIVETLKDVKKKDEETKKQADDISIKLNNIDLKK
jgi:hypothetical protein